MKYTAAIWLAAVALLLASCADTTQKVVDANAKANAAIAAPTTQADIALACGAVQIADAGFQIAVKAGYTDANAVAIESKAMAAITTLCTPPYPQNTGDVVKTIFAIAAQVSGLTAAAHASNSQ